MWRLPTAPLEIHYSRLLSCLAPLLHLPLQCYNANPLSSICLLLILARQPFSKEVYIFLNGIAILLGTGEESSFCSAEETIPPQLAVGIQMATGFVFCKCSMPRKAISHRAALFQPAPWMPCAKPNLLIKLGMTMRELFAQLCLQLSLDGIT